jgi:nitroreductase
MEDNFKVIQEVISNRRSVKPAKMNGKHIPDEKVYELLKLADWAPTHKITEPWRFIVFSGDKAKAFCLEHAELYKKYTSGESFSQDKYDKFAGNGNYISHLIIAVMKRSLTVKIPEIEEIAAVSAAVENLLIGATASGLASFWSTGGMVHSSELKQHFRLGTEDKILGIIYLGYTDNIHEGKRIIPLSEKIDWK